MTRDEYLDLRQEYAAEIHESKMLWRYKSEGITVCEICEKESEERICEACHQHDTEE